MRSSSALYGETLGLYGVEIGLRHARKHLGWALDAAAETAGVPAEILKMHRSRVLTATDPTVVLRLLAEAFDVFESKSRRDSAAETAPIAVLPTPLAGEGYAAFGNKNG